MAIDELRANGMMAHLLDALEKKRDIGHYRRLVFAMIARNFLDESEVVKRLKNNPGMTEEQPGPSTYRYKARTISPPRRERILEWQKERIFDFPDPENPENFLQECMSTSGAIRAEGREGTVTVLG